MDRERDCFLVVPHFERICLVGLAGEAVQKLSHPTPHRCTDGMNGLGHRPAHILRNDEFVAFAY
jgi:hypothetical protein